MNLEGYRGHLKSFIFWEIPDNHEKYVVVAGKGGLL